MRVAKTKALISFAVTAKLICVFVFAYAKSWFSHDEALMSICNFHCFSCWFRGRDCGSIASVPGHCLPFISYTRLIYGFA